MHSIAKWDMECGGVRMECGVAKCMGCDVISWCVAYINAWGVT